MADIFDRKKLLIWVSRRADWSFSLVLAWLARGQDPSIVGLVLVHRGHRHRASDLRADVLGVASRSSSSGATSPARCRSTRPT